MCIVWIFIGTNYNPVIQIVFTIAITIEHLALLAVKPKKIVVIVIICQLDLPLPVQSVHITTKVVSSNPFNGEVYLIQHYVIKFVSDLYLIQHYVIKFVSDLYSIQHYVIKFVSDLYSIQHYVIKFVSDLRHVDVFSQGAPVYFYQ